MDVDAAVIGPYNGIYDEAEAGDWCTAEADVSAQVSDGLYFIDALNYVDYDCDGESWSDWISAGAQAYLTGIYPDNWTAGSIQNFTISGGDFGSSPSLIVTGDTGCNDNQFNQCWGIDSSSDTGISAWVNLTYSSGGTAGITVLNNDYNSEIEMGFYPVPGGGQAPTGDSGSAQIAAPPPKPWITSVDPAALVTGTTTHIAIAGGNLDAITAITAQGVSFTNINSINVGNVEADATVSQSDAGGQVGLTVTTAGGTSEPKNIMKQRPSELVRSDAPGAPSGVGPLMTPVDGDVVNLADQTIYTHQCGVYRNYAYDLADQNGAVVSTAYELHEYFTDYAGPVGTPEEQAEAVSPGAWAPDIQYFGHASPACLATNEHEIMNQKFYIKIGTTRFDLTTVINIQRGNFSGTLKVDETITTP